MVHALELIRQLLKPDGILLDIHPTGIPPRIEVIYAELGSELAGNLCETDDFIEYHQAGEAIEAALAAGWFTLESHNTFIYDIFGDNPFELIDFLAENWKDAIVRPEVVECIQLLQQKAAPAPARIVIRDKIWLNVLRVAPSIRKE